MTAAERYGRPVSFQINSIGPCSDLNDRRPTSQAPLIRDRSDTLLMEAGYADL